MKKTFILIFMLVICSTAMADNPVVNYFKQWVDETRIDNAIGNLISIQFKKDLPKEYSIAEDKKLSRMFTVFLEKAGAKIKTNDPKVFVVESSIPDEILLPGCQLILTRGFLQQAVTDTQIDFIMARNAHLSFLKQPLAVIKREGIYPKFLDFLKLPEAKRSEEATRFLVKSYLNVVSKMKHKQADLQGALLTSNPDATRKAAIEMLSRFSVSLWPPMPLETVNLPSRIEELKKLKLNDQNL